MGNYLIKSSESKYNKKFANQLLLLSSKISFGKIEENEEEEEEEEEEKKEEEEEEEIDINNKSINKDNSRTLNEGGRWNLSTTTNCHITNREKNYYQHYYGLDGATRTIINSSSSSSSSYNYNSRSSSYYQYIKSLLILILIAMTFFGITYASPTPSLNNNNNNHNNYYNEKEINLKKIDQIRKLKNDNLINEEYDDGYSNSDSAGMNYHIEEYNNNNNNNNNNNINNNNNYDDDDDFLNDDDHLKNSNYNHKNQDNSNYIDSMELDKIRETIMMDLGITKIPDPSKANVSQTEYEKAHREYLKRVELSKGQDQRTRRKLHVFYPADPVLDSNSSSSSSSSSRRINLSDDESIREVTKRRTRSHSILYFPFEIPGDNIHAIDHANLRILIGHEDADDESLNLLEEFVEVSVYQLSKKKTSSKRLIANQRVSISRFSPRWADFDSTEAVASWLHDGEENLGFQIEMKRSNGVPIILKNSLKSALNVFTISEKVLEGDKSAFLSRNRRATPDQLMSLHRGRRTECKGQNKKCCRHQMTVIFKDLIGFEFIIQPKDFDAGYCKGRCPPRYNPAHHHALLQSLIWKEDRKKAPRPCCAPSKLTELEILYFDENDATKLKVSNWKNMKVLECACS